MNALRWLRPTPLDLLRAVDRFPTGDHLERDRGIDEFLNRRRIRLLPAQREAGTPCRRGLTGRCLGLYYHRFPIHEYCHATETF